VDLDQDFPGCFGFCFSQFLLFGVVNLSSKFFTPPNSFRKGGEQSVLIMLFCKNSYKEIRKEHKLICFRMIGLYLFNLEE
jgi:hypothetical protein